MKVGDVKSSSIGMCPLCSTRRAVLLIISEVFEDAIRPEAVGITVFKTFFASRGGGIQP